MTRGTAAPEHYHPWRHAAELGVSVVFMPLQDGMLGCWVPESRTVFLSPDLDQAERRVTLTHELVHAVRGDEPCITTELELRQEARVEATTARLLIPLDHLAEALKWCRDEHELAEELWVDEPLVRVRLTDLTNKERAMVEHLLWAAGEPVADGMERTA